jgi:hypothetical protein
MGEFLGYQNGAMIGRQVYDFLDATARAGAQRALGRPGATGENLDLRFRRQDGTEHCGLGGGQADDLAALTAWVEDGRSPATLSATLTTASGERVRRDLCRYPLVSHYVGQTKGFRCVPSGRDAHSA